jgi:hypothetical protein
VFPICERDDVSSQADSPNGDCFHSKLALNANNWTEQWTRDLQATPLSHSFGVSLQQLMRVVLMVELC